MKQTLKPRAAKPSEGGASCLMACLLKNEPASYLSVARLRQGTAGARAKASPNRAHESLGVDPKPRELPMARLKVR